VWKIAFAAKKAMGIC